MQRFALKVSTAATVVLFSTMGIMAQITQAPKQEKLATLVVDNTQRETRVALGNNLFCAGFVQTASFNTSLEIVGADEEGETRQLEQNDYVYISGGSAKGVKVGDEYTIVRPRGKAHSPFSRKRGLGVFAQELGVVRVFEVRNDVAVAEITLACDSVMLGDLLQPLDNRVSPLKRPEEVMDRFAAPNGKATGRLFMGRDGQEALTKDQIVYIDLGAEDNVKTGDYFTVYRPLGKKLISPYTNNETGNPKDRDFESEAFHGGKFSNMTPRKAGSEGTGDIVTADKARKGRPANLRKVVGEVVILNVKERTATAVITRVIQEVHPGDFVELQ